MKTYASLFAVLLITLQRALAAGGTHPAAAFGSTFCWAAGFVGLAVVPALVLVRDGRTTPPVPSRAPRT